MVIDTKAFPSNYCMGNKNSATRMPPSRPTEKSAINTAETAPRKTLGTGTIFVTRTQSPTGNAQPLQVM